MNGAGTSTTRINDRTLSSGMTPVVRSCTGPCGKRRSPTQFAAGSTVCRQCVLRTPNLKGNP